jgi:hypothetical protein
MVRCLEAKDGFEPSLLDLQSNTLPLCYLACEVYGSTEPISVQ